MLNIGGYFLGNTLAALYDDGIANVLGLETLRHGTSPINYFSIKIRGGLPAHGGKDSGSTVNWRNDDLENTKNHFYLFKDSELKFHNHYDQLSKPQKALDSLICSCVLRFLPRLHVFLSGYNFTAKRVPKSLEASFGVIAGVVSVLLSPTLRFRFSKIDSSRLLNDDTYDRGQAYRTPYHVEPWRIGLVGSILTGVNLDWYTRAKVNPMKITTGVLQIIAAIFLTKCAIIAVAANPCITVPLMIGSVLS